MLGNLHICIYFQMGCKCYFSNHTGSRARHCDGWPRKQTHGQSFLRSQLPASESRNRPQSVHVHLWSLGLAIKKLEKNEQREILFPLSDKKGFSIIRRKRERARERVCVCVREALGRVRMCESVGFMETRVRERERESEAD